MDLRVEEIEGEPWFAIPDIGRCIGADLNNLAHHVRGASGAECVVIINKTQTPLEVRGALYGPGSRSPRLSLVSEAGLYRFVLRAQTTNPRAVEFQKWVTSVVLPPIRKTGGYIRGEENLPETHSGADLASRIDMIKSTFHRPRDIELQTQPLTKLPFNDLPFAAFFRSRG